MHFLDDKERYAVYAQFLFGSSGCLHHMVLQDGYCSKLSGLAVEISMAIRRSTLQGLVRVDYKCIFIKAAMQVALLTL